MELLTKFIPDTVVRCLFDEYHYSTNIHSPTSFGKSLETIWQQYNALEPVDILQPAMGEKLHLVSLVNIVIVPVSWNTVMPSWNILKAKCIHHTLMTHHLTVTGC